jgi:hypothetical protein
LTQTFLHPQTFPLQSGGGPYIIDQVAAVLILQAFLEARANQRGRS